MFLEVPDSNAQNLLAFNIRGICVFPDKILQNLQKMCKKILLIIFIFKMTENKILQNLENL